MSVNKVILVGNLGADPESRTTGSGTVVATLRLATTERTKERDSGNWTDHTEWHRVVCFGKVAENVTKYLKKGRQIYIEGKIRTRKWQDKEGHDKYTTEVIADNVQFLGGGGGGGGGRSDDGGYGGGSGGGGGGGGSGGGGGRSDDGGGSFGGGGADEDIPF